MATRFRLIQKTKTDELKRSLQKKLKEFQSTMDSTTGKIVGDFAVEIMKSTILKGISPIESGGKFPTYTDKYKKQIKGRKGKFSGKKITPVNLTLTGKFLEQLKHRITKSGEKLVIQIGFFDKYGQDLESGHREQTNSRPIIPLGQEKLSAKIRRQILDKIIPLVKNRLKRSR